MKIKKVKSGFTLVEMLLYVTVLAGMSFLFLGFLDNILKVRIKQQSIFEVERQGLFIVDNLKKNIEEAESIILPEPGFLSTSLSVVVNGGGKEFKFQNGNLNLLVDTEIIPLNNSKVELSDFSCFNFSQNQATDVISCSFTLSSIDDYNRFEYSYAKSFRIISAKKN